MIPLCLRCSKRYKNTNEPFQICCYWQCMKYLCYPVITTFAISLNLDLSAAIQAQPNGKSFYQLQRCFIPTPKTRWLLLIYFIQGRLNPWANGPIGTPKLCLRGHLILECARLVVLLDVEWPLIKHKVKKTIKCGSFMTAQNIFNLSRIKKDSYFLDKIWNSGHSGRRQ